MSRSVDDYVAGLSGWQARVVEDLRRDILGTNASSEILKWNHPVYVSNGPVCLIQAHKAHVTFGFWRGAEMVALDSRLVSHGSFSMASIRLTGEGQMTPNQVRLLVERGAALNLERGNPLDKAAASAR